MGRGGYGKRHWQGVLRQQGGRKRRGERHANVTSETPCHLIVYFQADSHFISHV